MSKNDLPSKALRDVYRRFKGGYTLERTGGGHFRIKGPDGEFVKLDGKILSLVGNPSPGVQQAWERELTEARVLKGTERKEQAPLATEALKARIDGLRRAQQERDKQRTAEAAKLKERLEKALHNISTDVPGVVSDLGHVGAWIARRQGKEGMTPDLTAGSANRLLNGNWVEPRYQEIWVSIAETLEAAPDPVGEWFNLVREARGLPADRVQLRQPKGGADNVNGEWPFRVELIPLSALLVDPTYQRPISWAFVRREAARFDPALVGTIDVAQRTPSRFAVLDGQQRTEIVRMVSKETIWASVYTGLDLASEARFFLHKNRDRKTIHPYYTFRARVAAADPEAVEIEKLVTEYGYRLAIGAPRIGAEDHIAAIAAVEAAYRRERPDGNRALEPTLRLLKTATFGRTNGQNNVLIRGLSATFAYFDPEELDEKRLTDVVAEIGPDLLLGRARDLARDSGGAAEGAMVRVLLDAYNKGAGRKAKKLELAA